MNLEGDEEAIAMGEGTKENPYTREDVLRRIKENGGTAEGLDLSGQTFEKEIDLRGLNLNGIILKKADFSEPHLEGAYLIDAHLERAFLLDAHLEGAVLWNAHLEGADLGDAHLEGADLGDAHLEGTGLRHAHLEGAVLGGAEFSPDTRLEDADWGNFILGEERNGWFTLAVATYRRLKIWYTNAGIYDIAGKFFFREMTARRKAIKWWPKPWNRFISKFFLSMLCGYGEKPERVIIWTASVIFGSAIAYYFWGTFDKSSFWDTLYYSAVSFTAVGYGQWALQPTGWAKGMGVAEAFIGVFTIALFLVTFTRKMTR